jgi:hypothetical protein
VGVYGGGAGKRRAMLEHNNKMKMMMKKKKKKKNKVMQQQVGVGPVARPSLPLNFMRVNQWPSYEFDVLFFFVQKNSYPEWTGLRS